MERPGTFDLVVNRKSATAIGVTIAPAMLLPAERVIE
jgi:hypothetical protein